MPRELLQAALPASNRMARASQICFEEPSDLLHIHSASTNIIGSQEQLHHNNSRVCGYVKGMTFVASNLVHAISVFNYVVSCIEVLFIQ